MKLHGFSILADENIGPGIIQHLRSLNFEVFSIVEEGEMGKSDLELLHLAKTKRQIILTQDSDFGTLVFRDEIDFVGIFYLRPGHFSADFHISTLKTVIAADLDLEPPFILVAENTGSTVKIRLRSLN